jgi:hypothetical protein
MISMLSGTHEKHWLYNVREGKSKHLTGADLNVFAIYGRFSEIWS